MRRHEDHRNTLLGLVSTCVNLLTLVLVWIKTRNRFLHVIMPIDLPPLDVYASAVIPSL